MRSLTVVIDEYNLSFINEGYNVIRGEEGGGTSPEKGEGDIW